MADLPPANCAGDTDRMYDPGHANAYEEAKAVCRGCPRFVICRAVADQFEKDPIDAHGVWAGETPKERIARRAR